MRRRLSWRRRLRSVFLWHRYLGAAGAFFLLTLALTGFALNHSEQLGLDGTRLDWPLLNRLYGLAPEAPPVSYRAGRHWITALEGRWYLDGQYLGPKAGAPIGAVAAGGVLALASRDSLTLALPGGEVVERLEAQALPSDIAALGTGPEGRVVLRSADGISYRADQAVVTWQAAPDVDTDWSRPAQPPPAITDAVLRDHRGAGLPATRVLADLHSGRILGLSGQIVMDLAGLALLALIGTGFYNWLRRRH